MFPSPENTLTNPPTPPARPAAVSFLWVGLSAGIAAVLSVATIAVFILVHIHMLRTVYFNAALGIAAISAMLAVALLVKYRLQESGAAGYEALTLRIRNLENQIAQDRAEILAALLGNAIRIDNAINAMNAARDNARWEGYGDAAHDLGVAGRSVVPFPRNNGGHERG